MSKILLGKAKVYMAEIKLYGCTINYLKNPCGIDENPRFSYKISSDGRGGKQLSRRIRVSDALTGHTVWDSGEVKTDEQVLIPYEGDPLSPITEYRADIEIKTENGEQTSGEVVLSRESSAENGTADGSPPTSKEKRESEKNFSAHNI